MFEKIRKFIRFWKYNTHPARMEYKARKIVLFGAGRAFDLFRDKEFRRLLNFDQKDIEEQNRIFNELVVTNLTFLMLLLDQLIQEAEEIDEKQYLEALRKAVPAYFKGFLRRIGISKHYLSLWNKLIEMRYTEQSEEVLRARAAFLNHPDPEMKEYALDKLLMIFQAVVFCLYDHLVRGKIKVGDPIYKYLQPYLVQVHKGYLKRI
jgi:hypothetical protein